MEESSKKSSGGRGGDHGDTRKNTTTKSGMLVMTPPMAPDAASEAGNDKIAAPVTVNSADSAIVSGTRPMKIRMIFQDNSKPGLAGGLIVGEGMSGGMSGGRGGMGPCGSFSLESVGWGLKLDGKL